MIKLIYTVLCFSHVREEEELIHKVCDIFLFINNVNWRIMVWEYFTIFKFNLFISFQ